MKLLKTHRSQGGDFGPWMTTFELNRRNLASAWEDLRTIPQDLSGDADFEAWCVQKDLENHKARVWARYLEQKNQTVVPEHAIVQFVDEHVDRNSETVQDEYLKYHAKRHSESFPISDNLLALFYLLLADLNENQRSQITTHMLIRKL